MKHCLECGLDYIGEGWTCPACGFQPSSASNFMMFAPDLSEAGGGFDASFFGDLATFEASSFWFQERNKIILWALAKYAPEFRSFLEVGCGTGFVLRGLDEAFPDARLVGSEVFVEGLEWSSQRLSERVQLIQMDGRRIPFTQEFEVVGAFDVLEHIEEDERVLTEVFRALIPSGIFIATVPQHEWLWSKSDEFAHHVRRYEPRELDRKLADAGFEVIRSTSFVTSLLPAMFLSRKLQSRKTEYDPSGEFKINPVINQGLRAMMSLDLKAIQGGASFKWGGSRLVVAKKKAN